MSKARTVLPTDLMALVSYNGRVYPNEAKTWDRLNPQGSDNGPHPLETAIEQWFSFATGKHTWVSVRGATIRGLVSARRRAKRTAWEVDCLIDADEDKDIILSLLSRMTSGLTKLGAERVFLRLAAESPLVEVTRRAGFFAYSQEALYCADQTGPQLAPNASPLRPRTRGDALGLFQLYNQGVPNNIRAIEGTTLREWQAALEPWGGRPKDFILEENNLIDTWLRILSGHRGRFSLLTHPRSPCLEAVLQFALARLAGSRCLLCLVPSYDVSLARSLEQAGFSAGEQYVRLAKRLLKPIEELAPEAMRPALPVS
ncbi:MAG: hypothetical protein V3S01_13045 [Dehalococcoidia bacterium]